MVTLHDVALKAGVTAATVSNVIRNKGVVGHATRQRVLAAIDELGYRPNLMARGLVEGKSFTLALIVEDISNPFYAEVALELERRAREKGYHLLLCNALDESRLEKTYLDKLLGGWVDGLVAFSGLNAEDALNVVRRKLGLVLGNWSESYPLPDVPTVDIDFRLAGYLAGQHLTGLGHRHLAAIISGNPVTKKLTHSQRLGGFCQALGEARLELPEPYLRPSPATIEGGYRATRDLLSLEVPPSALFASNDLIAIGALEAAKDAGLRVPEELSIVGIDDIALSAHVRPSLTTIALSRTAFVEAILGSLWAQLERGAASERHSWVKPYLVERQSTAAPQGGGGPLASREN